MALQFDQLNNQLKTNDSTNANASMVLTPAGTGSVLLNGTGQNLLTYSQQIGGTNWSGVGSPTITLNAVSAPDSTLTATTLGLTSGAYIRQVLVTNQFLPNVNYTFSCYIKASASGGASNVRLTTNNTVAWNTGLSTKFALTSSWQRFSLSGNLTNATGGLYAIIGAVDAANNNDATCAGNIDVWGAQLEFGTTTNTYIPTTTAAIYNAPQLSFSGVANIGLQSDGSMYVQPAGTGALQAQATTSSVTGGNARGVWAVDWQLNRNTAAQVASGLASTISGGYINNASGSTAVVSGGTQNTAAGAVSVIAGGIANTATASNGGNTYSFIGAGYTNTAAGIFNFIGGGYTNSGTANASVTSQATTSFTSGSTAVTLSGSNASIKVGQLITGTGIQNFPNTYVAAISGTSLTLSQNATATGTPTLTFWTPHGVVVGGGNNQATGAYSFIGGGGDAGTAANRNAASGDWSFIGGGTRGIANNRYAAVVGGVGGQATGAAAFVGSGGLGADGTSISGNIASGTSSVCVGGYSNSCSGGYGSVLGGSFNASSATSGSVIGGRNGTDRTIAGNTVFPGNHNPLGANGNCQSALLVLARQTTDATPTVLASDVGAAGSNNQVILPNNSAYYVRGSIVAGVTGAGNTSSWTFQGTIKRGANAAATSLVAAITPTLVSQDVGAATWAVAITADTTNGGLAVTVTGQAATTIRWVCKIETTEMTY